MAMRLLEGDIQFTARKYWIPGLDREDLEQELRLRLWCQLPYYDHTRAGLRAWAKKVMSNHAKNLLRDSKREKRGGNCLILPLNEDIYSDNSLDIEKVLDILHETGKKIEDIF